MFSFEFCEIQFLSYNFSQDKPKIYAKLPCVKSVQSAFGLNISPYSVRILEITNQKNSAYGHFSRSVRYADIPSIKNLLIRKSLWCILKSDFHLPNKNFLLTSMITFKNGEKCFLFQGPFALQIFKFLFRLFGHVEKGLDKKDKVNLR